MCNSWCNSCGNGINFTMPVFGELCVRGNSVSLRLRSSNDCGCSGGGRGGNGRCGNCACGCGSDSTYGSCYRNRTNVFASATSDDGETNFFVNRCGSSELYGSCARRRRCCCNG